MFPVVLYLLSALFIVLNVECKSELIILQKPEAFQFHGYNELPLSQLKNVLSTSLGYTVKEEDQWSALELKSPFSFVDAIMIFVVPEMNSLRSYGKSYPLIIDENIDDTFDVIASRTQMRYPQKENILQKIVIEDDIEVLGQPELQINNNIVNKNSSDEIKEENEFVQKLNKLQAIVDQMLEKKNKLDLPDIFWINLLNMAHLSQLHGLDSKELLLNTITVLTKKISKIYNNKVFVAAINGGEEKLKNRLKREVTSPHAVDDTLKSLNVADDYDENFPVIFNIILWFSLALLFSLIAISMVIACMDPGRDSIIYRMTSTRMKKDN